MLIACRVGRYIFLGAGSFYTSFLLIATIRAGQPLSMICMLYAFELNEHEILLRGREA
jgi:hypothetical protein